MTEKKIELKLVEGADYAKALAGIRSRGSWFMGAFLGLLALGLVLYNMKRGELGGISAQSGAAYCIGAGLLLLMFKLYVLDMCEDVVERQAFVIDSRQRLAQGLSGDAARELENDVREVLADRLPDMFELVRQWMVKQGLWPAEPTET